MNQKRILFVTLTLVVLGQHFCPVRAQEAATDHRFLFKFGGALDLYFGAKWDPGNLQENNPYRPTDCRLLIAKVKGKPTAVLYRPVDPKAPKSEECVFESPIGKEVFASVKDITSEFRWRSINWGVLKFVRL